MGNHVHKTHTDENYSAAIAHRKNVWIRADTCMAIARAAKEDSVENSFRVGRGYTTRRQQRYTCMKSNVPEERCDVDKCVTEGCDALINGDVNETQLANEIEHRLKSQSQVKQH